MTIEKSQSELLQQKLSGSLKEQAVVRPNVPSAKNLSSQKAALQQKLSGSPKVTIHTHNKTAQTTQKNTQSQSAVLQQKLSGSLKNNAIHPKAQAISVATTQKITPSQTLALSQKLVRQLQTTANNIEQSQDIGQIKTMVNELLAKQQQSQEIEQLKQTVNQLLAQQQNTNNIDAIKQSIQLEMNKLSEQIEWQSEQLNEQYPVISSQDIDEEKKDLLHIIKELLKPLSAILSILASLWAMTR